MPAQAYAYIPYPRCYYKGYASRAIAMPIWLCQYRSGHINTAAWIGLCGAISSDGDRGFEKEYRNRLETSGIAEKSGIAKSARSYGNIIAFLSGRAAYGRDGISSAGGGDAGLEAGGITIPQASMIAANIDGIIRQDMPALYTI